MQDRPTLSNPRVRENQEAGVPPKHLAHMEVNVSELERNEDSRP